MNNEGLRKVINLKDITKDLDQYYSLSTKKPEPTPDPLDQPERSPSGTEPDAEIITPVELELRKIERKVPLM